MLAFVLSMPGIGSWNGKWSGEGRLYARVRKLSKSKEDELNGKGFDYRWNDGWCACVDVEKVCSKEAAKIRRNSVGFFGYDWMIDSIIANGKIEAPREQVTI